MTYLQILGWARKGIKAESEELREMQEKAIEAVGSNDAARKLADALQEQLDKLDVDMMTLNEIEELHNRK